MKNVVILLLAVLISCMCCSKKERERKTLTSSVMQCFPEKIKRLHYDYFFCGDSNVRLTEWERFFKGTMLNFGMCGLTTCNLFNLIPLIQSDCTIIHIGNNDLRTGCPGTVGNYKKILMKASLISRKIIVIGLVPACDVDNTAIIELNKKIRILCGEEGIVFVPVFDELYKDNCLNPDYTYDGIHLNDKGQEIVAEKIRKKMDQ